MFECMEDVTETGMDGVSGVGKRHSDFGGEPG